MRTSSNSRQYLANTLWLLLAALWLFPLGWTILSSFKTSNVALFERPFALPDGITFANYQQAIRAGNLDDYFINSILVTGLSVALVVSCGMWAGQHAGAGVLPQTRLHRSRDWTRHTARFSLPGTNPLNP